MDIYSIILSVYRDPCAIQFFYPRRYAVYYTRDWRKAYNYPSGVVWSNIIPYACHWISIIRRSPHHYDQTFRIT